MASAAAPVSLKIKIYKYHKKRVLIDLEKISIYFKLQSIYNITAKC